jgi:hypothetical protein
MHFPRYWTLARRGKISAWGWSDQNLAHAEGQADERLSRILDWLQRGASPPRQRYGYPDRPLREEVLREFRRADGALRAAVTRNSYGCLVLNTADLMFVDVDAPEARESTYLAGLFGFVRPDRRRRPEEFVDRVMAAIQRWLAASADWGWRVYRTRAGLRLMATHQPVGPEDAGCAAAFDAFQADPLYRKLCTTQKCFRARLTPKPWRCGMDKPRGRWPWANPRTEAEFREWETRYVAVAKEYATCSLAGQFGNAAVDPALRDLVDFHDEITRARSGEALA